MRKKCLRITHQSNDHVSICFNFNSNQLQIPEKIHFFSKKIENNQFLVSWHPIRNHNPEPFYIICFLIPLRACNKLMIITCSFDRHMTSYKLDSDILYAYHIKLRCILNRFKICDHNKINFIIFSMFNYLRIKPKFYVVTLDLIVFVTD